MATTTVELSHEKKRGCGYRHPGLYIESRDDPNDQGLKVMPLFVVLDPPVEAQGKPFRGYQYITEDDLWPDDGPCMGEEKLSKFRQEWNKEWLLVAAGLPAGSPAWSEVNWLTHRVDESTPVARVERALQIVKNAERRWKR